MRKLLKCSAETLAIFDKVCVCVRERERERERESFIRNYGP